LKTFSRFVLLPPYVTLADTRTQCIIPVIEGLLPPPHDGIILDLLFELSAWHSFAKLRLHTETTLTLFETATKTLGAVIRRFQKTTCEAYVTRELPQEAAARGRRSAALAVNYQNNASNTKKPRAKRKGLNLATYKYHALGDYVEAIRRYGPTDNYSTQVVSYFIHQSFLL
jgi:hypothetical protein